MKTWKLQDAKAKLSEVIRAVDTEGPQIISVRGEEKVALIPIDKYKSSYDDNMTALEALRPLGFEGVEFEVPQRKKERPRKIDL